MPLKMDARAAATVLREEAAAASAGLVDGDWARKVEHLSQLCESGVSKTHIAFLGTEILAKVMRPSADLRAIKPTHAPGNPNAYSARSLCHGVLVPLSAELGFSLGVSGREPLNNQPYFRMNHLGDDTPIHSGGRAAFNYMVTLVDELQGVSSDEAKRALRSFISVRRGYQRRYGTAEGLYEVTPERLLDAIQELVSADSEGGRRAQAVVAGLLDVVVGTGRVESGRVNDPSRRYPGDVAVVAAEDTEDDVRVLEKAFEVRDKPVRLADVGLFGRLCVDRGVREAAMVLVSSSQPPITAADTSYWMATLGVSLTIFLGWEEFVGQCLFWASLPKPQAATLALETIRDRLMEVEASSAAVARWNELAKA